MLAQLTYERADGPGATDEPPATDTIALDDLFDVLRNERRRIALRYLAAAEGAVDFGELVDHVAAVEHDTTVGAVDSGARKAVYTSLYQSHLPKLAALDVVAHDRQSGPVAPGPHLDAVITALDAVEDEREDEESRTSANGLNAILSTMRL